MALKQIIKRLLTVFPDAWNDALVLAYRRGRDTVRLGRAAAYDFSVFRRHSGLMLGKRRSVGEAQITRTYHRIEKGLALPEPRPGFGRPVIDQLAREVSRYQHDHAPDRTTRVALNAMSEYIDFNEKHDVPMIEVRESWQRLSRGQGAAAAHTEGGTVLIERERILAASQLDLGPFFASRHSVRNFSNEPILEEMILAAVRMAQSAPSVCNRQAGRVYLTRDPVTKARLLQHQDGNRGFGERIDTLFVITTSLDMFLTVGERYQCWIDGGLFAMSFIYALHSLGIGTCCLNWSVEPETDRRFKRDAGIPEDQAVIMLLAAGMLPERFRVAASSRRPLEEVMRKL